MLISSNVFSFIEMYTCRLKSAHTVPLQGNSPYKDR